MRKLLLPALLFALIPPAFAVSNHFTYQGTLDDAGLPANGAYDLEFTLIGDNGLAGSITVDDVAVVDGVFSVELDFGSAIDSGDFELQVGVRPGASSASYITLSPSTPLRPVPQAQVAALAGEAVTVSTNAIYSPNVVDGSLGAADVNTSEIQRRITATCADGSSIRAIAANGTVTCQTAGAGSVTSVASGAGLSGGPITGTGTLSIATDGVTSAMVQDGVIGSADINSAQVQRRVAGSCASGSSIMSIAADGTVTCSAAAANWSLSGNAGTDPAVQFVGTTDAQPLVLRAGNRPALRITPRQAIDGGSNTANLLGGSAANTIAPGVRGVTVLGGGADPSSEGFLFFGEPNGASGNYTTVVGGIGNRTGTEQYATVVGGQSNNAIGAAAVAVGGTDNNARGGHAGTLGGQFGHAIGGHSVVVGGYSNAASGLGAAAVGGTENCAGGQYSFVGGRGANTRPQTGTTGGNCESITSSSDSNGDEGSFVWADATTSAGFTTSGPNQFLVRADGGMMLNTNTVVGGGDDLVVGARLSSGDADADLRLRTRNGRSVGIYAQDSTGTLSISPSGLTTGSDRIRVSGGTGGNASLSNGGTWTNASSRTFKTAFEAVDTRDVLARVVGLDITRWEYIGSGEGRHMGPMAEDFKAAFDLAGQGKSIATVDADGVALAAIQGLNAKLEQENAELRARLDAIEAMLRDARATLAP